MNHPRWRDLEYLLPTPYELQAAFESFTIYGGIMLVGFLLGFLIAGACRP